VSGIDPKEASARRIAVAKRMSAAPQQSRFRGLRNWLLKRGGLKALAIGSALGAATEIGWEVYRGKTSIAEMAAHPGWILALFVVFSLFYALLHVPRLLVDEPWLDERQVGLHEGPPFDPAKLFPKKGPGRGAWRKLREPMRRPDKRD
jgi:hypothetical protein